MVMKQQVTHWRLLPKLGVGSLMVSLGLGIVLRHSDAGTPIDRWFQRLTVRGAIRPGQPGFHHGLFLILTRTTQIGTGRYLICFAGVAFVIVAAYAVRDHRWSSPMRYLFAAGGPLVALLIAGLSAEDLLKPLINRRMAGNLGVLTYPSGHAVATASLASSTVLALVRYRGKAHRPRSVVHIALVALLACIPLVVGLEMAVLRSHYLTDVIGGWAWGGGWGLLVESSWAGIATPRSHQPRKSDHLTPTRR